MFIVSKPQPGFILSAEAADALREDRKRELKALKKMSPEEIRQVLRAKGLLVRFRPISASKKQKKKGAKVKAARNGHR